VARASADVRERRRVSRIAALLRGAATAVLVNHAGEAAGPPRMNSGKRDRQFKISDALVAELAVARASHT